VREADHQVGGSCSNSKLSRLSLRYRRCLANHRANAQTNEWDRHIDRWRMTSFLLWYELFVNHNQELFSRIQRTTDKTDYVDDGFVPEFLRAQISFGSAVMHPFTDR
jgi:hypothetical protein